MLLYEYLAHTFVQMKFKVGITTKLAWCGIKFYVLTDLETAYVIKSIVFTGKYVVYSSKNNVEEKTIIWVVK